MDPKSPFAQLRRLSFYLTQENTKSDDLDDCPDALEAWREYTYRKIFTGTTHEQFIETDKHNPDAIDWLIAVASVDSSVYAARKKGAQ